MCEPWIGPHAATRRKRTLSDSCYASMFLVVRDRLCVERLAVEQMQNLKQVN